MASVITMQPAANNETLNSPLEAEHADILNYEENAKKKKDELSVNVEDCCCYFDEESFILLRCISAICHGMATCTENCCECCGDCLHNCCEGNEGGHESPSDGVNGACCGCGGSSSNNDVDDDCDCDCDCTG